MSSVRRLNYCVVCGLLVCGVSSWVCMLETVCGTLSWFVSKSRCHDGDGDDVDIICHHHCHHLHRNYCCCSCYCCHCYCCCWFIEQNIDPFSLFFQKLLLLLLFLFISISIIIIITIIIIIIITCSHVFYLPPHLQLCRQSQVKVEGSSISVAILRMVMLAQPVYLSLCISLTWSQLPPAAAFSPDCSFVSAICIAHAPWLWPALYSFVFFHWTCLFDCLRVMYEITKSRY